MMIERRYRFYAAHRNTALADKCSRLHGHRYGVAVFVEVLPRHDGSGVAMLFADIDAQLAPIFEALDHRTLLHRADPLVDHIDGCRVFDFQTSVENLAAWLLSVCRRQIPSCVRLALQETDSATVTVGVGDLSTWPTT